MTPEQIAQAALDMAAKEAVKHLSTPEDMTLAEDIQERTRAISPADVLAKVGANEPERPVKPCPDCGAQPARVWRPGGAFQMRTECACGRVTNWVMCGHDAVADSDDDTPQPAPDAVALLVKAAWAEAQMAMTKFPQPNYVISKVAEEAGEVVKAAIHCAEGRETAEAVIGEITQAMGMLMRLYVEGDQVHGLPALAACKGARDE